jgi:uncharacterized RDD family membrane protein YckC
MEATNKIRYPLASAPNRFFAKLLDYVLILLVVISLSVLVIINDPSGIENVNNLQQT